jgi:hypothetical protein
MSIETDDNVRFKGEPMIESPTFGTFVYDEVGEAIAALVNEKFRGTPAELKMPERDAPFTHSNTFRLFAINEAAREYGAKAMRPGEAQLLRVGNKLPDATTTYNDLGAVIHFNGDNHDIAKRFYEALSPEEKDLERFPATLVGLGVERTDSGDYEGLILVPTAYMLVRSAPVLSGKSGNFGDDNPELLRTGVPSKVGKGDRYIYVAGQRKRTVDNLGISRLDLDGNSDIVAREPDLAGAYRGGRVVLTSGEASAPESLIALHNHRENELLERKTRLDQLYQTTQEEAARIVSEKK